jgi:hypothetical protein
LVVGCGKKSPGSSTTPPPAQADVASSSPVAQPALTAWQQGDKAAAVSSFLAADWSGRPLFAPGSALSLTEDKFKSLSETDQQAKVSREMVPQLDSFKQLSAAVTQAGRDAAAKGDVTQARKCFTSLKQFGTALDSPDYTRIVQLVGQAFQKMADKDLMCCNSRSFTMEACSSIWLAKALIVKS